MLALSVLLLSCDGSDAPPPPGTGALDEPMPVAEPAAAAVAEPAAAAEPPIPALTDPPPFVFYEDVAREVPSFFGALGVGPVHTVAIIGDERHFMARIDAAAIVLERRAEDGAVRWTARVEASATGGPVVASFLEGGVDRVLVAAPTADGYLVEARETADGAPAWSTRVRAPGVTAVELDVGPERLLVFARAADADLVDALDLDGELVGRARFEHAITRAPIEAPEAASSRLPAGLSLRCAGRRGSPRAPCTLRRGDETLASVDATFGCLDGAAVEHEGEIVLAVWCPASSGVSVLSIPTSGGEPRWRSAPHGIGTIGHSRYSNRVSIAIDGGWVRVYGEESGGSYVSTLEPATGRELSTIVRRR